MKEVVHTYTQTVHIAPPTHFELTKARQELNKAWGYEDGNCNHEQIQPDGSKRLVAKKPGEEPEEFVNAHFNLNRSVLLKVQVSLHKDGTRTLKILE